MSSQRTHLLCLLTLPLSSFAAIAAEADINVPPLDVLLREMERLRAIYHTAMEAGIVP